MSHSIAMPYLVAYDIGNNKRLRNVHKHLKNIGIPMQYSLFYCRLTHQQHQQLLDQLDEMIVDSQDDIRIYPMPQKPDWVHYGRNPQPDDILFTDEALLALYSKLD